MSNCNCRHVVETSGHWEDNPYYDANEDEGKHGYSDAMVWVEGGSTPTTIDIDIHRYKCTQCGKIKYYSEAARAYYEDGIKSKTVIGLDK